VWESLPPTFVGMRSGVSMALVIVIVAEMFIGSTTGLGHRIINAQQVLNVKTCTRPSWPRVRWAMRSTSCSWCRTQDRSLELEDERHVRCPQRPRCMPTCPKPEFQPGPAGTHITIRGLTKYFAGWPLYEDFNLDIPKHKIVSVFGPNGCGKSR
jgi:ABC-type multidrug transport system fused ATPase/permease subunit